MDIVNNSVLVAPPHLSAGVGEICCMNDSHGLATCISTALRGSSGGIYLTILDKKKRNVSISWNTNNRTY